MQVTAYEGFVENGQIRLKDDFSLPNKTKVYVIIPGPNEVEVTKRVHVFSPRLVHPEMASEFVKEVIEDISSDDDL